jgi:hypothetical protein
MGIFSKPKHSEPAPFQPATIPFNSASQPPQWMGPKAAPLPANYSPPAPQPQFQQPQPQQHIVTSQPVIVQMQQAPQPQFQQPQQMPMAAPIVTERDIQPTIVATDPNAPVFVKIDKYEDILTELSDMKGTIQNIRNLAEVFNLVREVQLDSVAILDGLMKELERSQIKLDKVLGRLEDVEERVKTSKYETVRKVPPEELGDIEERIKKIREEINRLSK